MGSRKAANESEFFPENQIKSGKVTKMDNSEFVFRVENICAKFKFNKCMIQLIRRFFFFFHELKYRIMENFTLNLTGYTVVIL